MRTTAGHGKSLTVDVMNVFLERRATRKRSTRSERRVGRCARHVGTALWFCVVSVGCKDDPPEPDNLLTQSAATIVGAESTVHPIGETARARDYAMRVLNVSECNVEPHFRPPTGIEKLGVEVELSGTSERDTPVNPFYARLSTPGGERFEASLAGCRPSLKAERVKRGKQVRGWLSFDVPAAKPRFTLVYAPVVIGVGREELLFEIRR